jgi:hypothetical protein
MKKVLLIAAAALISASAIAEVTSANIVGYNKVETTNGFQIVSQQFDSTNATPAGLFGDTLPLGSKIYKYDPATGYIGNISEYKTIFLSGDAWSTSLDLSDGAFWVETAAVTTNLFSGEVNMAANVTNELVPGFNLVKYPYPVEVSITNMNITPVLGDKIYKYDPATGYIGQISEYKTIFLSGDAWSTELTFEIGEGFWYQNAAATTNVWVEARPF